LKKGDRVAFYGENSLEFAESYLHALCSGLVLVPLNFRLAPQEVITILSDSEPSVIIAKENYADKIEEIKKNLPFVKEYVYVGSGKAPIGWRSYEELIMMSSASEPQVEILANDLAVLMYTSGTTGLPKGVMQTNLNHYHDARSVACTMFVTHDDVGLVATPLYHVAGTTSFFVHLYRGCTNVILPRWDTELFLSTVEKEKIGTGMLVTPMIMFLANYPDLKKYDTSSLKHIYFGGAPVSAQIYKKFIETFGNVLGHYFGTTETTGGSVALTYADIAEALEKGNDKIFGSCGRRNSLDMQTLIVDENDNVVSPGKSGEMKARGLGVTLGYWRKEEATRTDFRNGWYYPLDICTVDEDGYIYVIDRKKDMIISGGENIYPSEIENVLYQHPDIRDAAIIGLPDSKWGESVTAVIALKEGKQVVEKQIVEYLRGKIASYKIPKSIVFDDDFPRSPSGKILKYKLREKYTGKESAF